MYTRPCFSPPQLIKKQGLGTRLTFGENPMSIASEIKIIVICELLINETGINQEANLIERPPPPPPPPYKIIISSRRSETGMDDHGEIPFTFTL